MPMIGFTEAARLTGVSRQHLYKMADSGQLSIAQELIPGKSGETPKNYRKTIDVAELQRVFGKLSIRNDPEDDDDVASKDQLQQLNLELHTLQQLLHSKEKQLQEAIEREIWFKKQIDEMTTTVKLIGYSAKAISLQDVVPKEEYDNMLSIGKQNYRRTKKTLAELRQRNEELEQELKHRKQLGFFKWLFN